MEIDSSFSPSSSSLASAQAATRLSSILQSSGNISPHAKSAIPFLQEFQTLYDTNPCDVSRCKDVLRKLKLLLAQFPSCVPNPAKVDVTELLIARETLEYAALVSVRNRDSPGFERHMAQLFTYYRDFVKELPASERQWSLLGLHLLYLLAYNRIGEFHMSLEIIPEDLWITNKYISHPVMLEHHLMDGNYNRVFEAKHKLPSPTYGYFMEVLVITVRQKIARCLEVSYRTVDLDFATRLLVLESERVLLQNLVYEGCIINKYHNMCCMCITRITYD
eukprot:GHVQ01000324.1.p1 GENE.GHVQ01000324.1~~GHVQ01000324.1.p1  ORF type:complete len:277 (-),score=37.00 GHVQ01000324.1:33-863(-)